MMKTVIGTIGTHIYLKIFLILPIHLCLRHTQPLLQMRELHTKIPPSMGCYIQTISLTIITFYLMKLTSKRSLQGLVSMPPITSTDIVSMGLIAMAIDRK